MSAYGNEMERQFSTQSSSGRGASDMGSRYVIESGFYMTSFTATIFIGALVTVGVLFITLLISLAVMLQYCENRSKGVVEIQKPSVSFNFCKVLSVHLELNSLETDEIPSICKDSAIQYIKDGQYGRDLDSTLQVVENYFCTSVTQVDNGRDVVLVDIDDVLFLSPHIDNDLLIPSNCVDEAMRLKQIFILDVYKKLRSCGWPLVLISRKPEVHRNVTIERLTSAGYKGWLMLIMRLDDEVKIDDLEYFTKQRAELRNKGFRIVGVMSSHTDALSGPSLGIGIGTRIYKLPNPMYFNTIQQHHLQNLRKYTQI